jgi:hypothetical protein
MNIFILDTDIEENAKYHCDKHVVKMIVEYAQLASTAHHASGSIGPYRVTHKNHPCAIWARASVDNYKYLVSLGLALCKEYTFRYNRVHKTQAVLEWLVVNIPPIAETGEVSKFALAMPEYLQTDDPVKSYRDYYLLEKAKILSWKGRDTPWWVS